MNLFVSENIEIFKISFIAIATILLMFNIGVIIILKALGI